MSPEQPPGNGEQRKFELGKRRRKFEISPSDGEEPRKRFEVGKRRGKFLVHSADDQTQEDEGTPNTGEVKKSGRRFEIHSSSDTGATEQPRRWFKQGNTHDCGPCLVLNFLELQGERAPEEDVATLRREVDEELVRPRGLSPVGDSGWLYHSDVSDLLYRRGYSLGRTWALNPENPRVEEVRREAREDIPQILAQGFDFVYTTTGSHFRGVMSLPDQPNRYFLLDSFNDAPQIIDDAGLNRFIQDALSQTDRQVNIQFMRKRGESD